jgi:PKD repeat protein
LSAEEVQVYGECKNEVTNSCIGEGRPSAKFNYNISNCTTVSFELNKQEKNSIRSIKWSFGDGTGSDQFSPRHTFQKFGNYKVKAIVTNRMGCTDTVVQEIKLAALNVDFVYIEKGEPGKVEFKAKNNIASYSWHLGNGTKVNNSAIAYATFTATGIYPIKMIAKTNTGCETTVTKKINIKLPEIEEKVIQTAASTAEMIDQKRQLPEKREKDLQRIIYTNNDSLTVSVYDNGIVDGDSVTLVYNDKIIATHLFLSGKPMTFSIKIDERRNTNELLMYAENLGSIPPNTSLMIIKDENTRYNVNITSSKTSNGVVSFILNKKKINASQ